MKKKVFLEHDGGVDDILSLMLLLTMKDVELVGVNVTPADCFIEPALESTYKVLQLFNKEHISIGRGDFYGINAFPNDWRAKPEIINALPMVINLPIQPNPYSYPNAIEHLSAILSETNEKISIVMTGPCSNLAMTLEKEPHLKDKIEEVIWMAGAFRSKGNVLTHQHNGTAEWNIFWDPVNTRKLFEMNLPLTLVPLDVTNNVPVNKEFLSRLAKQSSYPISNFAGQLWATTIDTIPSYHTLYFMWDILATSYVNIPERFTTEKIKAAVSLIPPNAGQTYIDETGYPITIATDVDKESFYEYILQQFKC